MRHVWRCPCPDLGLVSSHCLTWTFITAYDLGHLFLCLLAICISFLVRCRFRCFACFPPAFVIYLLLPVLGVCCCARVFSGCGAGAPRGGGFSLQAQVLRAGFSVAAKGSVVVACRLQSVGSVDVVHGLGCSVAGGIFPDWDQTHVSYIARRTSNHWTTRKAPFAYYSVRLLICCYVLSCLRILNNSFLGVFCKYFPPVSLFVVLTLSFAE